MKTKTKTMARVLGLVNRKVKVNFRNPQLTFGVGSDLHRDK